MPRALASTASMTPPRSRAPKSSTPARWRRTGMFWPMAAACSTFARQARPSPRRSAAPTRRSIGSNGLMDFAAATSAGRRWSGRRRAGSYPFIPDDAPCASIRNLEMFSTPHLGISGSMLAHRPGMTGEIAQARATGTVVMRGLDPRIHQPSQKLFERGWIAGSSPAMTTLLSSNQIPSGSRGRGAVFAKSLDDVAADFPPVHLVGTVDQPLRADLGVPFRQNGILAEAERAVQLDRGVDDVVDHVGQIYFCDRVFLGQVQALFRLVGDVQQHQPPDVELAGAFGEHELHRLAVGEQHAEGRTLC